MYSEKLALTFHWKPGTFYIQLYSEWHSSGEKGSGIFSIVRRYDSSGEGQLFRIAAHHSHLGLSWG